MEHSFHEVSPMFPEEVQWTIVIFRLSYLDSPLMTEEVLMKEFLDSGALMSPMFPDEVSRRYSNVE